LAPSGVRPPPRSLWTRPRTPKEIELMTEQPPASAPSDELIPELQNIHSRIATAKQDALQIVTMLTDEQAKRRPEPTSWSVVECLDHLCVVGRKLLPRIDAGIEKGRAKGWMSRGPFRYSPWGNWFVRSSTADVYPLRQKLQTPKLYKPRNDWPLDEVVRSFTHLQDDILQRVRAANGVNLARVKITSPAARWVRLSLGQWLELIAGHQERHLLQARDVRKSVVRS
jgi:hypothetical protein